MVGATPATHQDAATSPATTQCSRISPKLDIRPVPPVSIQEARLALARSTAAAQAASQPARHSDVVERRAALAMNLSWYIPCNALAALSNGRLLFYWPFLIIEDAIVVCAALQSLLESCRAVNFLLLIVKFVAFGISTSYSVFAR